MDPRKAADARLIAEAFGRLKKAAGNGSAHLFEAHLPGWKEGRRTGWSTAEVLAAIEAAIAKAAGHLN